MSVKVKSEEEVIIFHKLTVVVKFVGDKCSDHALFLFPYVVLHKANGETGIKRSITNIS